MRSICLVLACVVFSSLLTFSQSPTQTNSIQLRVFVQGDTSRLPDFVESMRREFGEQRMNLELVQRGIEYDYDILLAQESSLGGAAAAVVVRQELQLRCIGRSQRSHEREGSP
jgi:hypothetical protein